MNEGGQMILRKWRKKRRKVLELRAWNRRRENALFRASNGERICRLEREELNLPDWTG
jgi:hypothetical protein